jgi:hypothetical protein
MSDKEFMYVAIGVNHFTLDSLSGATNQWVRFISTYVYGILRSNDQNY